MKPLLFLFGTRPEFVKLWPVWTEAQRRGMPYEVVFTGQHQDLVLPLMKRFGFTPQRVLKVYSPGQSLGELASKILSQVLPHLEEIKPAFLVVQGDTISAAIAAMAAFYQNIPVAHVEAGLRTWNLSSPWPEEFNRRLMSLATFIHFAPTKRAKNNLLCEGFSENQILVTGNTAIDTLFLLLRSWGARWDKPIKPLSQKEKVQVLVTLHRRENFGKPFLAIMAGIRNLLETYSNFHILWPIHKNPEVKTAFDQVFANFADTVRLQVTSPLDYHDFVQAMFESDLIITDSGGVQEEAPALGKAILVCRDTTERPESVECGNAILVGTDAKKLELAVERLVHDFEFYLSHAQRRYPYGNGEASIRILDWFENYQQN